MKKSIILYSFISFLLLLYSCSGNKKEAKSHLRESENITNVNKVIFKTFNDDKLQRLLKKDVDGGLTELISDFKFYSNEIKDKWKDSIKFKNITNCNDLNLSFLVKCDTSEIIETFFIKGNNDYFVVKDILTTVDFESYLKE
ncbi:MAG: hypothetical protein AB8B61_00185 [Cyclobacteriaceae bacterium]